MVQNKYDLTPLENHLKQHPNASYKDLYSLCNATTTTQKSAVRVKKGRLLNRKSDTKFELGQVEKLSSEDLEKRIVDALNRHPDNAQILGKAIEFFIKIKGGDTEGLEQEIDMERFLNVDIGREKEDSPTV